ncbi:unnamed protein product [Brassica oleracea]
MISCSERVVTCQRWNSDHHTSLNSLTPIKSLLDPHETLDSSELDEQRRPRDEKSLIRTRPGVRIVSFHNLRFRVATEIYHLSSPRLFADGNKPKLSHDLSSSSKV